MPGPVTHNTSAGLAADWLIDHAVSSPLEDLSRLRDSLPGDGENSLEALRFSPLPATNSPSNSSDIESSEIVQFRNRGMLPAQDLKDIRRALVLASKLLRPNTVAGGASDTEIHTKLIASAFDEGLLVALVGGDKTLTCASFLSGAFRNGHILDLEHRRDTINRKFGYRVLELAERAADVSFEADCFIQFSSSRGMFIDRFGGLNSASTPELVISCASAICALHQLRLKMSSTDGDWSTRDIARIPGEVASFVREIVEIYRAKGVPNKLVDILDLEVTSQVANVDSETRESFLGIHRTIAAANYAAKLFGNVSRKWGPEEKLPLCVHAYDVGIMVALAGGSWDEVTAALLHDSFEKYAARDLQDVEWTILNHFGNSCFNLIERNSEPRDDLGEAQGFSDRKEIIFNRVKESFERGDHSLPNLVCSAKTSTLSGANKFLFCQIKSSLTALGLTVESEESRKLNGSLKRPTVSGWSKGSDTENLEHYERYERLFSEQGLSPQLLEQFRFELNCFRAWLTDPSTALIRFSDYKRRQGTLS